MLRKRLSTALAASAVVLTLAASARADGIPSTFDQLVTVSTSGAASSLESPGASSASMSSGDAVVTITGLSGLGGDASGTGTDLVLASISASKGSVGVANVSMNYTIRVQFDDPSHQLISDYADISGTITGTIEKTESGSMAVNLHNLYTPTLGSLLSVKGGYLVSDGMFTRPGSREGTFGAHVTASGTPLPPPVPEPASLALWSVLGLGALGLLRHRRQVAVS